jgi:hypothetical protein
MISERAESAVVTSYLMLFGHGADIQARDRITRVTLEGGTHINATFSVKEPPVIRRRARRVHHLSAALERLS